MTETQKMTLTVEIPSGKLLEVESQGKQYTPKSRKILQDVDETGTGMKIACVVLYKHTNPLCFYYFLPNGEEVQVCF